MEVVAQSGVPAMSTGSHWLRQFGELSRRCGTVFGRILTETVRSLGEVFRFGRRLATYGLNYVRLLRLGLDCSRIQLLAGQAALKSEQGDERLRSQLSNDHVGGDKAMSRRERKRLLRRLAADVRQNRPVGETAELVNLWDDREIALAQLAAQLDVARRKLLPAEPIARRQLLVGTSAVVLTFVLLVPSSPESTTSAEDAASVVAMSDTPSPQTIQTPPPKVEPLAERSSAPPQLKFAQTKTGLVVSHPMVDLDANLTLVISFVVMHPDHPDSHDVRGLLALVDVYDFEESPNRNNVPFAKLILHAGSKQFSLLLPDLEGGTQSMRYCYRSLDARDLHEFLYEQCHMAGYPLEVEISGRRYPLNSEANTIVNTLVGSVATQLRSHGYIVAPNIK